SRIGKKYLKGGVAYGGPCFPRDNKALVTLAHSLGAGALIAEATDQTNSEEPRLLAKQVMKHLPQGGIVGILGFSYKPNTDVVEKSLGLLLAQRLAADGVKVVGHDPVGMDNARRALGGSVQFLDSVSECLEIADVLVITTAWAAFRGLDVTMSYNSKKPKAVVDCWDILDPERVVAYAKYVSTGVGPAI
ncbi:MAG: UDP binding domain-containing protein, partial [Actinomycetota bacterium]